MDVYKQAISQESNTQKHSDLERNSNIDRSTLLRRLKKIEYAKTICVIAIIASLIYCIFLHVSSDEKLCRIGKSNDDCSIYTTDKEFESTISCDTQIYALLSTSNEFKCYIGSDLWHHERLYVQSAYDLWVLLLGLWLSIVGLINLIEIVILRLTFKLDLF